MTELDIRLNDGAARRWLRKPNSTAKSRISAYEQPACKLIQTWGFTDKYSWIPGFYKGQGWALPWDDKYRKKPAYEAMHDALAK